MVYRRRRYSRRYRRKGKRTLSTRNVFLNKSARSQAYQIAALKKQCNRIWANVKPEWIPYEDTYFINARHAVGNVEPARALTRILPSSVFFDNEGNNRQNVTGDKIRIRKLIIYGTLSPNQGGLNYGQARVIVLTSKRDIDDWSTEIDDFDPVTTSNANTTFAGPLVTNITENFRVLADRKLQITAGNNIVRRFRINIPMNALMDISHMHEETRGAQTNLVRNQPIVYAYVRGSEETTTGTFMTQLNMGYRVYWTDV